MISNSGCKNFTNGQLKGSCLSAKKFDPDRNKESVATGFNQSTHRFRCRTCPADLVEMTVGISHLPQNNCHTFEM